MKNSSDRGFIDSPKMPPRRILGSHPELRSPPEHLTDQPMFPDQFAEVLFGKPVLREMAFGLGFAAPGYGAYPAAGYPVRSTERDRPTKMTWTLLRRLTVTRSPNHNRPCFAVFPGALSVLGRPKCGDFEAGYGGYPVGLLVNLSRPVGKARP